MGLNQREIQSDFWIQFEDTIKHDITFIAGYIGAENLIKRWNVTFFRKARDTVSEGNMIYLVEFTHVLHYKE